MTAMIKPSINPWHSMPGNSARRVDYDTSFNYFWIIDGKGRYGLLITFNFLIDEFEIEDSVKGISVVKSSDGQTGKLYFLLLNNKDWEIFLSVCTDLVNMSSKCISDFEMIPIINQRIRRWQKFLKQEVPVTLPEITQMGLFSELHCFLNMILPFSNYKDAIQYWVGPNSDKKDFSLEEYFIEVKSFISSKGPTILISSLQQLDDEIKPVYLLSYGLSRSEKGLSIVDLIEEINSIMPENDSAKEDFESKIVEYGYIQGITEPPFFTYHVDIAKSYLVSNDFPRLLSANVDSRITTTKYTIDLSKCETYVHNIPFINQ